MQRMQKDIISFFTGELIYTLIYLAVRVVLGIYRRKVDWKREAWLLLLYVNLAVLIRFTFSCGWKGAAFAVRSFCSIPAPCEPDAVGSSAVV